MVMSPFLLSRRRFGAINCAAARNECTYITLAPTSSAAVTSSRVQARKSRVDRQSTHLESRLSCHKVLQATEADEISEQSPNVIVRTVSSIESHLPPVHLN